MASKARQAHGKARKAAGGKVKSDAPAVKGTWARLYEYPKDARYVVVEGRTGHRSVFPKEPLELPARS